MWRSHLQCAPQSKRLERYCYEANHIGVHRRGGAAFDGIRRRSSGNPRAGWLARPLLAPPGAVELSGLRVEAKRCPARADPNALADRTADLLCAYSRISCGE